MFFAFFEYTVLMKLNEWSFLGAYLNRSVINCVYIVCSVKSFLS